MDSKKTNQCGAKCEIYSRVCGYFRPVSMWNRGKKEEFRERKVFNVPRKIIGIFLLLFLLSGCATSEQLAKNLNAKNVAGSGLITDNRIGLDPETMSPVLKSVIISGDFQTIRSDGNYLNFKREESSAWYNSENKTTKWQLTITSNDNFIELLKYAKDFMGKISEENTK